jgi:hypothetical protein
MTAGDETFTVSDETFPSGTDVVFQGTARSADGLTSIIASWDASLWEIANDGYPKFKWVK